MGDGGDDSGRPPDRSDDGDGPSLRDLAEKVRKRRGRSDTDGEDASDQSGDGFVFPGSDRDTPTDARSSGGEPSDAADDTEFGSDAKTEAIIELIGDASNVLLLGPLLCPTDHDFCTKLLTGTVEDLRNLLLVTFSESPDERVGVLRGFLDELPENVVIINVGGSTRSSSRETVHTGASGQITVETIADPGNVQRIGIGVSKNLSKWEGESGDTAICFHSLTALLQFADDRQRVFRFLHILRGRTRAADVRAHYHMDAGAHDDELLSTYQPLFDEVLRFEEDGSIQIDH